MKERRTRSLRGLTRAIVRPAVSFLFPDTCLHCGSPLSTDERHLCMRCRGALEPRLRTVRMAGTRIPAIQYLLPFEGPAGDLVRALKYGGRMSLARDLSSIVLGAARQLLVASDGRLEAMPLHRTRLRERGFNQCALLARELARATGLSLSGALSRLVNTHPQADLPRRLRLSNPVGAFLADPGESSGKRFVLLDDVVTTGATMAAAATALLDAGAESVVCLAIAGTSAPGPKAVDGAHSDVYDSNL